MPATATLSCNRPLWGDILVMAVAGAASTITVADATNLNARGAPPPLTSRSAAARRAAALRRLARAAGAYAPCFAVTSLTGTSVTADRGPDGLACATTDRAGSRGGATESSVLTAPPGCLRDFSVTASETSRT